MKKEGKKMPEVPNFRERMAKIVQVLSNLNENLFDFFAFAVKKFRGSSLAALPPLEPEVRRKQALGFVHFLDNFLKIVFYFKLRFFKVKFC
ncbi:MAG: hypothetical protein LBJ90_06195 [Treponema sp.]|nr:hypothetical protein [Treponema sp.]